MLGLGGLVVIWSEEGTEEDWVLGEGVEEEEGEVVFREGGVAELGFVQVVGDGVAAGNVLVETGAGMRTEEICFTG